MATKGKITDLYDIPEIEAQHAKVLVIIQDIVKSINDVKPITISLQGAEKTKDVIDGMNKVSQATQKVAESSKSVVTEYTSLIDATKKVEQAQKTATNSLQQSSEKISKYKLILEELTQRQKDYKKLLEDGKISIDEYSKKVGNLTQTTEQYRNKISELNKEIKASTALQLTPANTVAGARADNVVLTRARDLTDVNDVARIQQINDLIDKNNALIDVNSDKLAKQKINIGNYPTAFKAAFGTLQGELVAVSNTIQSGAFKGKELEELTIKEKALKDATSLVSREFASTAAQQTAFKEAQILLGKTFGTNSDVFKQFTAGVKAGNVEINNISKAATGAAENSAKLTNGFSKFYGVLRNIAYAIPGIGLGGLIALLLDPLTALASKLVEVGTKSSKINDEIYESFKKGGEGAIKQAADLQVLYEISQNTNLSLHERKKASDELLDINKENNKVTGENNKLLTDSNGILKEQKDKIDLVSDSLIRQAKTKAVLNLIEKAYGELIAAQNESLDNSFKNLSFLDQLDVIMNTAGRTIEGVSGALTKTLTKGASEAQEKIDNLKLFLAKGIKDKSLSLDGLLTPKGGDNTRLKEAARSVSTAILKQQAEDAQKLSEITSLEAESRIRQRQTAADKEIEIIKKTSAVEIENEKQKLDSIKSDPSAKKNQLINAETDYAAAIKKISQKSSHDIESIILRRERDIIGIKVQSIAKQKELDAKANADTLASFDKDDANRLKRLQDELDAKKKSLADDRDQQILAADEIYRFQIQASNGNQKKIEDATKQYNLRRAQIEFEYAAKVLAAEIANAKKIIALREGLGLDTTKAKEALAKAEIDLDNLVTEHTVANTGRIKKTKEERLNDILKAIATVKTYSDQVFGIAGGALDAYIIARKNALEDESVAIDKKKEKEIEAVNSSLESEEKKAAKIQIINARAQSEKEAIDRKQKQLDQEKARFDKAKGIADIVLNTANAIVKQLIATPLPFGAPFIAAIAALGAAQLAVAIATPIPRYKSGTMDAPGGLAIVGDGGKQEIIRHPDGSSYFTPDKPTLVNLPEHAQVFADADSFKRVMEIAAVRSLKMPEEKHVQSAFDHRVLDYYSKQTGKIVAAAVQAAPRPVIKNSWSGWEMGWTNGRDWWQYVKDSI